MEIVIIVGPALVYPNGENKRLPCLHPLSVSLNIELSVNFTCALLILPTENSLGRHYLTFSLVHLFFW